MRSFASWRTAHTVANLHCIKIEFSEGSTERVPVHTKLFGSFALVSSVMREHFENVALFELTYSFRIGDTGAMHLRDQTVQFALQSESSPAVTFRNRNFIVPLRQQVDPIGCIVLELRGATQNLLLKVIRYNEGYRMRSRKEIGR